MAARIVPTPGVSPDGWVSLGVVTRAHGIKGALKFHPWAEQSAVLGAGLDVQLGSPKGWRTYRVAAYAPPVLQLDGVHDRTAAEALQGLELRARRADFPEDEDATWLVDLVGAQVVTEAGQRLGDVMGFSDNGAQALLEVETSSGPVLVPFVPPILQGVEHSAGSGKARVILRPPAGLFDDDAVVDESNADESNADESNAGPASADVEGEP